VRTLLAVCCIVCSTAVGRADDKPATPPAIDYERDAIDVRDAVIEAAAAGKLHVVMSADVKGCLSVSAKKVPPRDALTFLALATGCVVRTCGDVTVVVHRSHGTRPSLPALPIGRDKKTKTQAQRSADVRLEIAKLARMAELPVVVGREVTAVCPVVVGEVPIVDVLEALAWANGLSWTVLDKVLFVGTPAEVSVAAQLYDTERQNR